MNLPMLGGPGHCHVLVQENMLHLLKPVAKRKNAIRMMYD